MTIRGLIFDFDGLILDTETPDYLAWAEIYTEHGHTLSQDLWSANVGHGASTVSFSPHTHLESLLGRTLEPDSLRARRLQRLFELIDAQETLAGVESYIFDAKRLGLKLGVASSSDCPWVTRHLTRLDLLSQFDRIRCADDVKRTKPDPELYLAALEALGLRPEEAIAFEDSPVGALAAKRAGIYCVAIPNPMTKLLPQEHADRILDSLAELPLKQLLLEVENLRR